MSNADAAKDVTQGVFMALAEKAPQLAKHPALCGWLHCTVRNLAAKTVRCEQRRQTREQRAAIMSETHSNQTESAWEQVIPHLDAALGALSPSDRDAILLRFFEKKSTL